MNSGLVGACIILLRKMNTSSRAQYNRALPPWLQECESSNASLGFVAVKANFAFTERKCNNIDWLIDWSIDWLQLCYAFSVIYPQYCLSYLGSLLKFQSMRLFLRRVINTSFYLSFIQFLWVLIWINLNQLDFFARPWTWFMCGQNGQNDLKNISHLKFP